MTSYGYTLFLRLAASFTHLARDITASYHDYHIKSRNIIIMEFLGRRKFLEAMGEEVFPPSCFSKLPQRGGEKRGYVGEKVFSLLSLRN